MKIKMILCLVFALHLSATIINIPADQPTIQTGIDIAVEGDTVLVAPGTYYENIEIYQKNDIHVIGSGADVTTIDGNENGHVVTFNIASGSICEFSITNSGNDPLSSCGIFMSQSMSFIKSNIIENNCRGISVSSSSEAQIYKNVIVNNIGFRTISITSSIGNISYNLIADNLYNGIYNDPWSSLTLLNNTIVGNSDQIGLTLNATVPLLVRNNIVTNFLYGIFVLGDQQSAVQMIDIAYNDVWNNSIANYWEEYGIYPNFYSQPFIPEPGIGEIHQDPLFINPFNGNYYLQSDSPCIDAGDPNSPFDPDGTIADMGAFYYNQGTGVQNENIQSSLLFPQLSNYPNPFNPSTTIEFTIQNESEVELSIFNIKGQLIESQQFKTGIHNFVWDASKQSSGIYLYKLNVNGKTVSTKKCLLLK